MTFQMLYDRLSLETEKKSLQPYATVKPLNDEYEENITSASWQTIILMDV